MNRVLGHAAQLARKSLRAVLSAQLALSAGHSVQSASFLITCVWRSLRAHMPHHSPLFTPQPPLLTHVCGTAQSLPVAFGIDGAAKISAGCISLTQLGVAAYMAFIGETPYALGLLGLLLPQMYLLATLLLPDPVANDVKFQAASQPFFVFGILCTAVGLGHHQF